MRELSEQEKVFLELSLPGSSSNDTADRKVPRGARGRRGVSSRLSSTVGLLFRYLPLVIGIATLAVAALATYLYIWGFDFFKISEVKRLSENGTLGLMDGTSSSWLEDTLQIFEIAPWIILGIVIFGILLMGLSMILVRKKIDG